ncbi:disulfide isomerase secreted with thioredoxin plus ER retention motif [Cryptosporidium sp. chipmunk genotype I]|uniref:disulfide isomerase secreted with thioredoxin plus ER retention motif n=1 Tax=Cryptosporidium sp. chipmunk genotype I TaxID=1280935 RepID=UPI00351A659D|nr:disulfide isomerase secreted with thioredoxin plus ER retention motif [Cryptosporidium sp. chipmunk genotype I]
MRTLPGKLAIFIAIFITLISNISCGQEIEIPENVTELNDENFEKFIDENNLVLVLFYDFSSISKSIIQGLEYVSSNVIKSKGTGKIAVLNHQESSISGKLGIYNPPKLMFFFGSIDKFEEYPSHLSGLEKESMVSVILSKENALFIEHDSRNSESLEKAMLELDLETKVRSSHLPVLVYYGKPDTKRTDVVKRTLEKLRVTGVHIRAFIVYVKYKADIGLHIYRLPDSDRQNNMKINPKKLYVAKKRIFGLLEWNEQVLSLFVEACIRPYVSFKGNELMYVHESSNSLISFLKGSNTLDKYGSSNIEYLDHESMESLKALAKANFFPEDPDKDLMVGLVLPGLEQDVESYTGFYRKAHVENGTFLLKLRKSKFDLENSGKSNKFLLTEEEIKRHGLKYLISQARSGNLPIFYKSKRILKQHKVSINVEQYFTTPYNYLELSPSLIKELIQDPNNALIVLYYTEMCFECDKLLPIWNSISSIIASKLNKDSKFRVYVSTFDLEFNDNPIDMEIEKIPIVYYFPFGDNKISKMSLYNDELTIEAVTTFITDRILEESGSVVRDNGGKANQDSPNSHIKDEL